MQQLARSTAQSMQQAWSDGFFNVITGDFKKLPDIARQFTQSMLHAMTDEFAKMATAPLLRGLSQAFGGGRSFFSAAGAGAFAGAPGLPGGSTITLPNGQVITAPGGMSSVLNGSIGLPASGSMGWMQALMNTPLSAVTQYGLQSAVAATAAGFPGLSIEAVNAITAGGFYSAADYAALYGGAELAGAGGANAVALGGATLGSALGIVGAGVGFAFSLYGAYQSGSPLGGAISGAVSGAVLGTMIYPGIGTVVGLVAGAALGAGAGALGKEDGKTHQQRESEEWQAVRPYIDALGKQLEHANSIREIYDTLAAWGPGHAGVAIISSVSVAGVRKMLYNGSGPWARATVEEFVEHIDSLRVGIQAGVSDALKRPAEQQLESFIKQKVGTIARIEASIQVGLDATSYDVVGTEIGGSMISRLRLTAMSRLREARTGSADLTVFVNTLFSLPDDVLADLLRELARVDRDHALRFFAYDPATSMPFRVRPPRLKQRDPRLDKLALVPVGTLGERPIPWYDASGGGEGNGDW
jgi:hypothetical protein